jgi:drug/metabolite transporter (DMT)-like permease
MGNYLKIVTAMLIWSTWGPMIRWLHLPPAVVLFYTSLTASFTVPLVLMARGEFQLNGIGQAWWLLILLVISSMTNNITYFYALGHTTVSNAVFSHYTAPVFVALLAPLIIKERIQKETVFSLPIAATGMFLIVLSGGGLVVGGEHAEGIIAGTVSGVAYAFIIIVSRQLSRMLLHHKAVVVLLWVTTVALLPYALVVEYQLTSHTLLLLIITGLMHSTLAPLLYFDALRKVIAQHAAILGYMEPLAAVPMAFVLLSEKPGLLALGGGVLILFSGYLVVRTKSSEKTV